MNIKSAKYNEFEESNVSILVTLNVTNEILSVPINTDNTDYQAILVWAAIDGNSIAAAD